MVAREVVPGVRMISGRGLNPNVYLLGDTVIDSVPWWGRRRLMKMLAGVTIGAHVLQHAHPPTAGCSGAIAATFDVPVLCGQGDLAALQSARYDAVLPDRRTTRGMARLMAAPPVPTATALAEGALVDDFVVLDAPGHSPGHLAFWREQGGVLLVGDVITNETIWTRRKGLHEPPGVLTRDAEENRRSARRLAELDPQVVLFTHGAPLLDGRRFSRYVLARC